MSEITLPAEGISPPAPSRFASNRLADFPLPQGREEVWRFTPLSRISEMLEGDACPQPMLINWEGQVLTLDQDIQIPGAQLSLSAARSAEPLVAPAFDRAGAVAWHTASQSACLEITGNPDVPLFLDLAAGGQASVGHLQIIAAENTQSTVLLRHAGSGSLNEILEIQLRRGAQLNLVSVQVWEPHAKHLSTHHLSLESESRLKHGVITLGGDTVRISAGATLAHNRADIEMLGLYFTDAGVHHEHRLFIDHQAPDAKSRVSYKGALQGMDSHAVWVGDVGIGSQAYGTDSYESNRNLILGKGPRVDSVPNLEIHNGQIEGAGHASATGRFDDEQLFYLQSRGLDPVAAKRLVVKAFYAELLNEMEIPELTDRVLQIVDSRLEQGSLS